MTLILSESDIESALKMEDCLDVIEQTFADFGNGEAVSRPEHIPIPTSSPERSITSNPWTASYHNTESMRFE